MKVCIDPGHGGYDPGAVGPTGLKEKDVAMQIALQVGQLLQAAGIQVAYTRTSDSVSWPANVNQDLAVRSQIANNTGASLFCSIHLNSGSAAAHGTETYCYQTGGNAEKAGTLVQAKLVAALGLTNRGNKTANYYVLRKTSMSAILTEVCFISNPTEEALARTVAFVTKAAQAIAAGIAEYFGVALKTSTNAAATQTVNIKVAGKVVQGIIQNNTSYVPVRALAEALGKIVTWDGKTNTVIISPISITPVTTSSIKIITGLTTIPATMVGNSAYAAVRTLAVALEHKVTWDEGTNTITVK
ncbi:MAG: N-acetylmuramoyl-L-alanine amidase [Syntrophomonas sp.]